MAETGNLRSGQTKSCGCLRKRSGAEHPLWSGGRCIANGGYIRLSIGKSTIFEHRLKIEKALGKPIPEHAVPHHFDLDKTNNENSNLVLCQDRSYHNFLHRRHRAYDACGHANWLKCCYCKKYDEPENLTVRNSRDGRIYARHTECHKAYMAEYRRRALKCV